MTKHGFDVSSYQGYIDWSALEGDFVIVRDGWSLSKDKRCDQNVKEALKAGFEIPGIYHFSYATNASEAEEEAKFAVNIAKNLGLPGETVIFFDFEYDSCDYCKSKGVNPDSNFIKTVTKVFCDKVKQFGYTPGVYTNADFYDHIYKKKIVPEDAVIWAAKWSKNPPNFKYTFWQTGTASGLDGVDGKIDVDVWECSETETKKTNEEIADEVIRGDWGVWPERKNRLEEAGYDYEEIQSIVDDKLSSNKKSNDEIAYEVIRGDWGNGVERRERLEASGYDYDTIQDIVNKKLSG